MPFSENETSQWRQQAVAYIISSGNIQFFLSPQTRLSARIARKSFRFSQAGVPEADWPIIVVVHNGMTDILPAKGNVFHIWGRLL